MLKIILKKGEEDNVLIGYPWIFNNEIMNFDGNIKSGEVCEVYTFTKEFLCYGFFNSNSKIMVRVLSLKKDDIINYDFFKKRIVNAYEHRKTLGFENCYRLIFSEADFLPGLVVDKYNDHLSVQFSSLGMDNIKKEIIDILVNLFNPVCIFERSDSSVRVKEGLEPFKGLLYGKLNKDLIVLENDIKMYIDIENGQKTGYFLDQKLNRDYLKYYVKDKTVLDLFSHTGGFALHAAKYNAKQVYAVDISEKALEDINKNKNLNNFNNIKCINADCFEFLRENSEKYDIINLDPPAFVKNREKIKNAIRGYKEINLQALKRLNNNGYLFTYSCSNHMSPELFMQTIKEAVIDSKRVVQFIDYRIQSPDHPTLFTSNEQLYLKCIVLRIVE
ncbi:MAG: class I SAM-dependent rRNA methyltransferase [Anaeroplasmataceae bacterium]